MTLNPARPYYGRNFVLAQHQNEWGNRKEALITAMSCIEESADLKVINNV